MKTLEAHYSNISKLEAKCQSANGLAKGKLQFAITESGHREWTGPTIYVAGKRQARSLAVSHGATPWNF